MAMDASPLAKLPPELRNRVYHEVLCQKDPIVLIFKQRHERQEMLKGRMDLPTRPRPSPESGVASRGQLKVLERKSNRMAITATCKPLRQETRDFFFAMNSFAIDVDIFGIHSVRNCKDKADELIDCFLEFLSTRSTKSMVKSIILNLGLVDFWPAGSTLLRDMVTVHNDKLLRGYLDLPTQVKAEFGLEEIDGPYDVHIDLRNLASSIEVELEQVEKWRQQELEYWFTQEEREITQAEFDVITSQLKACLPQDAATEEV